MRPLCADLNRAIVRLAPPFVAGNAITAFNAESDYRALVNTVGNGPMPVWYGASEQTIYGDPSVNWSFRAWHDTVHLRHGFDFSDHGERLTCEAQISELRAAYPRCPDLWVRLIRLEIVGQLEHVADCDAFPVDQAAFTLRQLAALNSEPLFA